MIIRSQSEITEAVLAEIARASNPRFREIMAVAVRHLHDFVRDAKLTEAEFQLACALHRDTRPAHQRIAQRSRTDGGLARRVVAGMPAEQRRSRAKPRPPPICSVRSGGWTLRGPRTADRLFARRRPAIRSSSSRA